MKKNNTVIPLDTQLKRYVKKGFAELPTLPEDEKSQALMELFNLVIKVLPLRQLKKLRTMVEKEPVLGPFVDMIDGQISLRRLGYR
ncbi:MAG: hypothetical protein HZA81_00135 [Candidatus Taylorbacteria bacterium]|nr:hypothetical protein [Candidatus Taylorbacteria bacterium]